MSTPTPAAPGEVTRILVELGPDIMRDETARDLLIELIKIDEIASTLGVSRRTIDQDWAMGRMWLRRELKSA